VAEQTALIEQLRERIRELEVRLAKDSHNSSRPLSSDSPSKKPPPRSQRQPSGRKPSGQPGRRPERRHFSRNPKGGPSDFGCKKSGDGHGLRRPTCVLRPSRHALRSSLTLLAFLCSSGVTRFLVDHPDQCVIIPLTGICACGRCGTGIAATVLAERRQVVEVEIQRKVHQVPHYRRTCACGRAQRSTFPAGVETPVQYGPRSVSAFAVYMTQYQLLPYQRTAGVLNELASLGISPGTLQRTVRVAPPAWRRQSMRFATPMPTKPAGA